MATKRRKVIRAAGDIANDVKCDTCNHMASAHTDVPAGDNTGKCTMQGCDCTAMADPAAKASAKKETLADAPPPAADPAPASDATPVSLAQTTSDALEAALSSLGTVDISTADATIVTFVALVHAADNSSDMLLTSLGVDSGVSLDDDAGDTNMLAETVDATIVAARDAGALIDATTAGPDISAAIAAVADADAASGDLLDLLGAEDPDEPADTPDPMAESANGETFAEGEPTPGEPAPEERTFTMPIMVIEGVDTGDGRYITPECLTWRDLPIPVMAITKTTMGHDEAELVGRIDTVERIDISADINPKTDEPYGDGVTALKANGVFAGIEEADRVSGLIVDKFLRGVSIDLGDVVSMLEMLDEDGEPIPEGEEDDMEDILWLMDGDIRESVIEGRVMGATICPFPAFEGAYIVVDGSDVATPVTSDIPEDVAASARIASIVNIDEFGMRECIPCKDGVPLVASAGPMAPPEDWFSNPGLDGPTPLTINDDGHIFGHLATWGVCHTGVANQCVTAPKSKTNYGYFRTGAVKTAEGSLVSTGTITMGGGHAGLPLGPNEAIKHYDESGYGIADVASGEDRYGIWISGAMRPDATAEQIRRLRACALSGDWRQVGGTLELVAALAVNVPGFPIVRSQVASGVAQSLVAAGARGVMLSAQSRAEGDRAMMASMRSQWPLLQSLVKEREKRAETLRAAVKRDKMRHAVHATRR